MNYIINAAILIICLFNIIKSESHYEFTDKTSGTFFDFSKLKREVNDPWTVKKESGIFTEIFRFNFGENVLYKCKGKSAAVIENTEAFSQPTPICQVLGDLNAKKVELINKSNPHSGIIVEYGNGDVCHSSLNIMEKSTKITRFYLYCNSKMDSNFQFYENPPNSNNKCILNFQMQTPYGCPYSYGLSIIILIWLTLIFTCYVSIGLFYNIKKRGYSGIEAVPNIDFWRDLPELVKEGLVIIIRNIKNSTTYLKTKINNKTSSYYNI